MDPGKYNPKMSPRGSWRKAFTFTLPGALPTDPRIPMPLTGCEARAEVRPAPESDTLLISVNEVPGPNGYITIDEPNGIIEVFISAVATEVLEGMRSAAWDLFIEWPNGEDVDKALYGKVSVLPSVTDPSHD